MPLPPSRTPLRTNGTRTVRCDDEIWAAASKRARTEDDMPMTAAVGLLLWLYAERKIDLPDLDAVPRLAHYATK